MSAFRFFIALFTLAPLLAIASSPQNETTVWTCQPIHWVNLRVRGAEINSGDEPEFSLTVSDTILSANGKDSWLNESVFMVFSRLNLGGNQILKGVSEWNSQLVFNVTNGEFFHTSASTGVAVSMVGKCYKN